MIHLDKKQNLYLKIRVSLDITVHLLVIGIIIGIGNGQIDSVQSRLDRGREIVRPN